MMSPNTADSVAEDKDVEAASGSGSVCARAGGSAEIFKPVTAGSRVLTAVAALLAHVQRALRRVIAGQ
jgi:hypothetical protein